MIQLSLPEARFFQALLAVHPYPGIAARAFRDEYPAHARESAKDLYDAASRVLLEEARRRVEAARNPKLDAEAPE